MAVYTEVSDEALRAFLADYALGELPLLACNESGSGNYANRIALL